MTVGSASEQRREEAGTAVGAVGGSAGGPDGVRGMHRAVDPDSLTMTMPEYTGSDPVIPISTGGFMADERTIGRSYPVAPPLSWTAVWLPIVVAALVGAGLAVVATLLILAAIDPAGGMGP